MRLFREQAGEFVAVFNAAEAGLMIDLVTQIRTLLDARSQTGQDDPLAGMVGLTVGPSTMPEDPAVARLLPDFHRDDPDLSAGLRMLREPEVIAAKVDAAATMLGTLPSDGGAVRLDLVTARSWLVTLNDIRLVFGVRLGVTQESEDDDDPTGEHLPAPQRAMYVTYRWLSAIQESLASALLEATYDDR